MKKLYHVTLMSNLDNIMKNGLEPRLGERSKEVGEVNKAIYLFPSVEDMDCALGQWLGDWYNDEYGEDTPLASLEINLPDDFPIEDGEVEYEVLSRVPIEPKYIEFFRED